jgi:signal transduction histidine kinase
LIEEFSFDFCPMLNIPKENSPSGLSADQDAAALLRKLGASLLGVAMALGLGVYLSGAGIRPSVILATLVGVVMLVLVRAGRLEAAALALCWGLLMAGSVAVYMFGLRSTGALVIPLAIMSAGWLLGRGPAIGLAAVGSSFSMWVYWEHLQGHERLIPQIGISDAMAHVAIFSVTAMLAAAMAATLRRQLITVNALAAGLQEANARLEERVAERSAQLASMQQKVMDTEKLTSLGAMVAGISHELNTPLGNALTVSTTLEASVQSLALRVESATLTRSDLAGFLSSAAEMSKLTTQSVTRAAALVTSFKQIAVDQTSEQRRSFQLNQVVSDNIAALRPSIRSSGMVIEANIAQGIACDSYPGPLGQVITNLLQNAVVHGFDGETGRVEVSAMVQGDTVHLDVIDSGRGMDPHVQARVFEPFFTTRLGKGGSGLGLSVSHRIARSVLGGDLTVRSEPGRGSTFRLTFPLRAPGAI